MMQNGRNNYRLVLRRAGRGGVLSLIRTDKGKEIVVEEMPWKGKAVCMRVEARGLGYQFYAGKNESDRIPFGTVQDASILSSNHAGGFIGPFIGMYASANGRESGNRSSFLSFTYSSVTTDSH